jgi:hypothetical protein
VLRHQLAKPLAALAKSDLDELARCAGGTEPLPEPLATLSDVFAHSRPPLALLEIVKRHGRKLAQRSGQGWPNDVGSLIYFAAIATALVRHGRRITKLDDDVLRLGFRRMLALDWVEPPLRPLLEQGLTRLPRDGAV